MQSLRLQEQEAISKAISILHSDDARDLFKKSLASQGYFFLQEMSSKQVRGKDAATRLLKKASVVSKDGRLMTIVSRLSAGGHFDEVIEAIDKMVATLKEEEADDLKQKETCEQDRADDTRTAIKTSRTMDELTEAIMVLKDEIEEAKKDKAEKEAEVESIKKELEELTKIRESENKEYLIAKADDEAASELVAQAKGVLETFYKDNDLMLSQTAVRQPFTSEAGKAPPPPPTTWDGGYMGKTDESTGIIAVLGMIKEDIDKDLEKATTAEKEAQDLFDETKKEMEGQMEKLDELINELTLTISKKEGEVTDSKEKLDKLINELTLTISKK